MSIEAARRNLIEREAVRGVCKVIFETSIGLLRENGVQRRDLLLWKYQNLVHNVNSAQPPVEVFIAAGANLDKAKKIAIRIEGTEQSLWVEKKTKGEETIFPGEKRTRSGYKSFFPLSLAEAQEYLSTVQRVAQEVR